MKKQLKLNHNYLLLTLAAVIWGIDSTVAKPVLEVIPPITFSFFRFLIGSVLFALALTSANIPKTINKKDLLKTASLAFVDSIMVIVLINFGIKYTTAANVSILVSLLPPIIIALLAAILLKEKLGKINILGMFTATLGVAFLTNLFWGLKDLIQTQFFLGNVLIVIAALGWAIYNIWGKPLFQKYHPTTITAYIFFFATLFTLPLAIWEISHNQLQFPPKAIFGLLYNGIGSGFIGYFSWNKGLKAVSASKAGIFTYIVALSGVIAAVVFLKESLSPRFLIGGLLTCLGLYFTTRKVEGYEKN
ncbi:DMT family transporter [Patescibacteria group bacterium]|nr:DMT family transporter [Patescibacteria group bacterium]MBU1931121.1 DMT family transporter [Patescibacteria group bacterium]